jgi:hypothetical protein
MGEERGVVRKRFSATLSRLSLSQVDIGDKTKLAGFSVVA